ncbi:MAG TPA: hypothetical protein VE287_02375, partial [Actinopolymorphaceae bacterium]|nr:hypothetical protein [Actinopolymorphaceae bacterium]
MTVNAESLGTFGQLAKAIGLLDANGQPNTSWFADPVGADGADGAGGAGGNQHGLRHVLADDDQRAALLDFVDDVLGPPDRSERAGETWVPLFTGSDPHVTVFAVVGVEVGGVRLGVAMEHTTAGDLPRVATRVHVPLVQFERRGTSPPAGPAGMPGWSLLGTAGARVGIDVDATFTDSAPTPGEAALAGVSVGLGIPTAPGDPLSVEVQLRDLQLPGAAAPRTFTVDASTLDELGSDVLDLVLGLVHAQADALSDSDPSLAAFRAVAGLLGLRQVAGLPPLPLADLPTRGLAALVGWAEGVLADDTARDAWLGELAGLVGGTAVPADDAIRVSAGPFAASLGIRVEPGLAGAGHPVLVPWVELTLDTRSGARARLAADLLRADTGTGTCTALPDVRVEAVFGADAGGDALLPGTAPSVGSLHAGVALDPTGRPTFVLSLHDVVVTSGGAPYDVLDLSSPSAAMDSASSVIEGALADAIAGLGPAGSLVGRLLGLDPPAGIDPLDVTALFSDPMAAIRTYWRDLTADAAAAADALGRLGALVTGAPVDPAPGAGTSADPWRVELVRGVELLGWRDGDLLFAALRGVVDTPVLREYEVHTELGLTLVRVDLATGTAAFAAQAQGSLSLRRPDAQPVRLALGDVAIEADALAVRTSWLPGRGLRTTVEATHLALVTGGTDARIPIDLPSLDADGNVNFPAPDWTAIERAAATLLAQLGLPVVDALLGLVGWTGSGAYLPLAGLVGADPVTTVREWLADLVLDCDRIRVALGPVAALLSGFGQNVPSGAGSARDPFRCPVAGDARAPGLAVWADPGCVTDFGEVVQRIGSLTTGELPDAAVVANVLRGSALALPDLADLLVGRVSLAEGFGLLLTRWAGTDGLVGRPAAMPDDVSALELVGLGYDELVALGSVGRLTDVVLDPPPAAVVHVGCEPTWVTTRPAGTAFDRAGTETSGSIPATGDGSWYVRLPTTSSAATARPDRGGVGEQAMRLAAVLADRTDPVVLVGYGACGAAVLRAAATLPAVSDAVTVGTPWAGVAVDSLRSGLGGDALRLLQRLGRADRQEWPDALLAQEATPSERMAGVIRRGREVLAPGADLPSAAAEARRTGLAVHAVFGSLDEDTLSRGLLSFVDDGIRARTAAASALDSGDGTARTALHAGIGIPVVDLDLGGLLVAVGATVELCRVGRAA